MEGCIATYSFDGMAIFLRCRHIDFVTLIKKSKSSAQSS